MTAQLATSSRQFGASGPTNPVTLGGQTDFDDSVTATLGGGFKKVGIRLMLWERAAALGTFV